LNIRHS